MDRKYETALRWGVRLLTLCLTLAAVSFFGFFARWSLLNLGTPDSGARRGESSLALMDKYDMYVTNQISEALDGVLAVEKVYWLNDYDVIAPEPRQDCFGSTADPEEVLSVLEEAAALLGIEEFLFRTDVNFRPGSQIEWYLDETIFVLTWQEVRNGGVYTLSEVKIAHASQMRRFFAGNAYGYGKQFLTTEMSADVNAVVASSGDFYKYRPAGVVVYNNQVHRSNTDLDTCFLDDKGDMILMKASELKALESLDQFVEENNIRFSLSFGPILIQNGVRCAPYAYFVGEIGDNYPRAALCQLEQLHYLLVVANGAPDYPYVPTLHEFASNLEQMGVPTAYTLDGGQTGVIVMNDRMISPVQYGAQRYISDILYFATALPSGG